MPESAKHLYIQAALIVLLTAALAGCINLTPQQEAFLYVEQEPVYITGQELSEILPTFATVAHDKYKLVPRGAVKTHHDAPWCAPAFTDGGGYTLRPASVIRPMEWICTDYSFNMLAEFPDGYAIGLAWSDTHMVTVFVDLKKQIILYDPMNCSFVRMRIRGIEI